MVPTEDIVRGLYNQLITYLIVFEHSEHAAEAVLREEEMVREITARVDAHPRGRSLLRSVLKGDIHPDEMREALTLVRGPRPMPVKTMGA